MKIVDRIIWTAFVIALIVMCFFQRCTLDIYLLVLGFAIAIIAAIFLVRRDIRDKNQEMQRNPKGK